MGEEIKIPTVNTKTLEYLKSAPDKIILGEKQLEYIWRSTVRITNEDGIPTEKDWRGRKVFLRSKISSVEVKHTEGIFELTVTASHDEYATTIFQDYNTAIEVQDKILNWLLK